MPHPDPHTPYRSPLTLAEWGRARGLVVRAMALAIEGRQRAFNRPVAAADLLRDGFTDAEIGDCFACAEDGLARGLYGRPATPVLAHACLDTIRRTALSREVA